MEENKKQKEKNLSEEALKEANALQKKAVQKQIQKRRYKRMYAAAYRSRKKYRTSNKGKQHGILGKNGRKNVTVHAKKKHTKAVNLQKMTILLIVIFYICKKVKNVNSNLIFYIKCYHFFIFNICSTIIINL